MREQAAVAFIVYHYSRCVCDRFSALRCRCGATWLLRTGLGCGGPAVCFDVVLPPDGAVENCYSSLEI